MNSSSTSTPDSAVASSKSSRKSAAGNRLDIGWKYEEDVDGNSKRTKCKFCGEVNGGGVYRLKNHLASTHKDVKPCVSISDEVRKEILDHLLENERNTQKKRRGLHAFVDDDEYDDVEQLHGVPTSRKEKGMMDAFVMKGKKQATINQLVKKGEREDVCQSIADFFYTSAIPFNCVNNPKFAKMIEDIGRFGNGLKPPTFHEIREKFLKNAVDRTKLSLTEFKEEWQRVGCSIMSDSWTDRKRRSICNFLVNSPKGTVFLKSIDASDISKTAQKVFEMLNAIVDEVGEENVVQVVTDNAANYKAAGERLMEVRKSLYWTPCAAHCIDLMLEDFEKKLPIHQETISRGRKITTYIYSRTNLISMLRHFTKDRDLIRPATTRFATAYLTLFCLIELKGALITMFASESWINSKFAKTVEGKRVHETIMDGSFWRNVQTCLKAAMPLIKVLRMVDSDNKPIIGFLYAEMERAQERIKQNFEHVQQDYEQVLEIVQNRWETQLHRPLHSTAYYLNPQFHYLPKMRWTSIKRGVYDCLERLVSNYETREKIDLQMDEFSNANGLFGIDRARRTRQTRHPADWWRAFGDDCPELQEFAIRVLSLTCSSSGCERNWSAFEMVHTKKRNRLRQKKMNDLVFVMANSKMMDRKERKRVSDSDDTSFFDIIESDDEWITEEGDGGDSVDDNEDVVVHEYNDMDFGIDNDSGVGVHTDTGDTSSGGGLGFDLNDYDFNNWHP